MKAMSGIVVAALSLAVTSCCTVLNGAAGSAVGIALPATAAPVASATIVKGTANSLLFVQATIQELGIVPPGDTMAMYPTVNGFGLQPDPSKPEASQVWKGCKNPYLTPDGSGDYPACSFTGTWWIDLDVAEAAHPGLIIGQPLVVQLNAVGFSGNVSYANVSLTAQLVKK
jgi:hypothetical protein